MHRTGLDQDRPVSALEIVVVALAGLAAGTVNTIVGSGSLITFPTLLAVGYPPLTANVTNTVGLVAGSLSGSVGYRRELRGQGGRLVRLGGLAAAGGLAGSLLLLVLPAEVFDAVVPALVLAAVLLVVLQPRLARRVAAREPDATSGGRWLDAGVLLTGVYGGYFGAAQGVLLLALLGLLLPDDLQRSNGLKNVLATLVNAVAAVVFVLVAPVAWLPALVLAGSSVVGGQLGASVGRRLPRRVLRGCIVAVGTVAAVALLVR